MSDNDLGVVFLADGTVTLRPVLKEDIPRLLKWINDPEIRYFVATYLPMMENDEDQWFENLSKKKDSNIVLVIEVDKKPIGTMGIHGINWKDRVGTTGALIGEKEYWDKGYGGKAKKLLLEYAFNILNLRKICSSVIEYNIRSFKYSLKCGYKEEGRLKKHIFRNGQYWDIINLAIFDEDWREMQKK